jgi:GNAT superfamily N-acetyltransferase
VHFTSEVEPGFSTSSPRSSHETRHKSEHHGAQTASAPSSTAHAVDAILGGMYRVRAGRREDGPALQAIERLAGARFVEVGLATVADDDPISVEELAEYADSARSWVAVDESDEPLGYVIVDDVDGSAHVEQMSVVPEHQNRGVGRLLLAQVHAWALATGRRAITLTTYTEVPWNRALYQHLGFRVLDDAEVGPELRAIREAEMARGLDVAPRVCMLRQVQGGGAASLASVPAVITTSPLDAGSAGEVDRNGDEAGGDTVVTDLDGNDGRDRDLHDGSGENSSA